VCLDSPSREKYWLAGGWSGDLDDDELALTAAKKRLIRISNLQLLPPRRRCITLSFHYLYGTPRKKSGGARKKKKAAGARRIGRPDYEYKSPMSFPAANGSAWRLARALVNSCRPSAGGRADGNRDSKRGDAIERY